MDYFNIRAIRFFYKQVIKMKLHFIPSVGVLFKIYTH
jgi:hypothetical protein